MEFRKASSAENSWKAYITYSALSDENESTAASVKVIMRERERELDSNGVKLDCREENPGIPKNKEELSFGFWIQMRLIETSKTK